jgi:hypothetical protein
VVVIGCVIAQLAPAQSTKSCTGYSAEHVTPVAFVTSTLIVFGSAPRKSNPTPSKRIKPPAARAVLRGVPLTKMRPSLPSGAAVATTTDVSNVSPHAMPSVSSDGPSMTGPVPGVGVRKLTAKHASSTVIMMRGELTSPISVIASSSCVPDGSVTLPKTIIPSIGTDIVPTKPVRSTNRCTSLPTATPTACTVTRACTPGTSGAMSVASVRTAPSSGEVISSVAVGLPHSHPARALAHTSAVSAPRNPTSIERIGFSCRPETGRKFKLPEV